MPTAVILLNINGPKTSSVAERIVDIPGVTEVFSVAGNFDLAVIARTKTNEELADLVTEKIRPIPGIVTSQTLIAFRTYSPKELIELLPMD
jgi:DNA-binding Lrp family transcriptional regulator